MLTYVINTSENKIFDGGQLFEGRLFEMAGYNRIVWMDCLFQEIENSAKDIFEKQSHLGAEPFRIAVLIDFADYDRIRSPYGQVNGYGAEEQGVEYSLYFPFLEAYISDHLLSYLQRHETPAQTLDVYYIQHSSSDLSDYMSNGFEQTQKILIGNPATAQDPEEEVFNKALNQLKRMKKQAEWEKKQAKKKETIPLLSPTEIRALFEKEKDELEKLDVENNNELDEGEIEAERARLKLYKSFSLHCTKTVSLEFNVNDYPYGAGEAMTFEAFYAAFRERMERKNGICRHHFPVSHMQSQTAMALDLISLSFYLVRMYEREEIVPQGADFEVDRLKPEALKNLLETSWNKICTAKKLAQDGNSVMYYLLQQPGFSTPKKNVGDDTPEPLEKIISQYLRDPLSDREKKMKPESYYDAVMACGRHEKGEMDKKSREELDQIVSAYLCGRDEVKETTVIHDLDERKAADALDTTSQYPSQIVYKHIVAEKEAEISAMLAHALAAEYVDLDFTPEVDKAKDAKKRYKEIQVCMSKKFTADIIAMISAMILMIVPYRLLQPGTFTIGTVAHYAGAMSLFGGLFVLAFLWQMLPLFRKLKQAKEDLQDAYRICCAKRKASFHQLRRRYEKELLAIEEKRYELHQVERLFNMNRAINRNVNCHRELLKDIEDKLSGMLTNLGVEPVRDPTVNVDGEFDIKKDVKADENSIYRILSLETIEDLFAKGR